MQKGTIKIYREIWSWNEYSAVALTAQLEELDRQRLSVIKLRVHCKGGDVMEGIAIYNCIKSLSTPVDMYIDGVCASMMTVIMLACRNVYMASNAFLMIHAPSGGVQGTAAAMIRAANALTEIEKNFATDYAAKTGKTEEEVKVWLVGDNWFSARQAKENNLINGIVEAVDKKMQLPATTDILSATPTAMYGLYTALSTSEPIINQSQTSMDKPEIIKQFGLTSVTAESTEEQIYAAIQAKVKDSENALEAEKAKQITAMVQAAKDAGKINDTQSASFTAIGNSAGIEALSTALGAIPAPVAQPQGAAAGAITSLVTTDGNQPPQPADNKPATFSALVGMGNAVLADYRANKPTEYKALYKAEFGHEPKL